MPVTHTTPAKEDQEVYAQASTTTLPGYLEILGAERPRVFLGKQIAPGSGIGGLLFRSPKPVEVIAGDLEASSGADWHWGIIGIQPGDQTIVFATETGQRIAVAATVVEDSLRWYQLLIDEGVGHHLTSWPILETNLRFWTEPPQLQNEIVHLPKVWNRVAAKYPASAHDAGIEGTVLVDVLVDEYGRAEIMEVRESSHELLSAEAMEAAAKCNFFPCKIMGTPIYAWTTLPYNFRAF